MYLIYATSNNFIRLRPYLLTVPKSEICPYMKMIEEEINLLKGTILYNDFVYFFEYFIDLWTPIEKEKPELN